MGSVSFAVEDESQPSTSNAKTHKFSKTFLDGCGAVNHASIPRKLRSAIKKRGRESVTSPLLFSRKQHDTSTTVDTLRKIGAKKSRLNKVRLIHSREDKNREKTHTHTHMIDMNYEFFAFLMELLVQKKGQITKDEEEVVETLFALAGMFSDTNKADQQKINNEKSEIKSSDTRPTLQEETQKISSKVTLESVYPSNLANPTAEEVISQSKEARQLEFFSSKKATTPNASGGQSDLSPGSASRPLVSILGMNEGGEQEIHLNQLAASGFQYGKNCGSISDKHKDLFPPPNLSATRAMSSGTPKSCPSGRSRGTNLSSSHPRVIEQETTTGEYTRVATKSNKSWKRCSAHVYISRLIKVLKISEREEGSPVKPTQPTTSGVAELQAHARINGRNGDAHFGAMDIFHAKKDSSEIQNGIFHKLSIQAQQMASETNAICSSKQGYDFLSLGTGESANRAECYLEPPKQYHMSYMQSENQSSVLCSLPRNGYYSSLQSHNSALEAHQVQLSQYHNNIASSNFMQQKWAAQLQMHYNTVSKNGEIDSASVLNYAHSLFPHLHAALGSKYQHLPPPQHQLMPTSTSMPLSSIKQRHNLPLGFERNGGTLDPASMAQLQLSCNQHL